jgi:hypothetical protein
MMGETTKTTGIITNQDAIHELIQIRKKFSRLSELNVETPEATPQVMKD